jgi:hypothetical protein
MGWIGFLTTGNGAASGETRVLACSMGRAAAAGFLVKGVLAGGKTPETRATTTKRQAAASTPKAPHCRKPRVRTFVAPYFAETDVEPLTAARCRSGAGIGMTRCASVDFVRGFSTTPKIVSLATGRGGVTCADRESFSISSWLRRLKTCGGRM